MSRSRFLDPSTLSPAERVVAAASWVGVLNAILPFWYRVETGTGDVVLLNAGASWPGAIAWLCFAVAGLVVLARAWIWPEPAPHRDGAIYALLGITALVGLGAQTLVFERAQFVGYYMAVLLAGALTVAGIVRRRERRHGWR